MALQARLAEYRLFWDTVAKALSSRDAVLIDSDKVKVNRNLLLFDQETLRAAPPFLMPPQRPERAPFKGPMHEGP